MSDFKQLEENLGYAFSDKLLLNTALTHPSYLNERKMDRIYSNQRLEFFGDSVLSLAVSEYIFLHLKSFPEGKLTALRAYAVCEDSLAEMAAKLGVGDYLILGNGEIKSGGKTRPSTLCDAMEAIIAAVYIDGGYAAAKELILKNLSGKIDEFAKHGDSMQSSKTELQEIVQQHGGSVEYRLKKEYGPEHAKHFEVELYIDGKYASDGEGSSKKRAEQAAAAAAVDKLKNLGVTAK